MPYLKIQTNQAIEQTTTDSLIRQASHIVAEQLGKSESYVMVAIEPPIQMVFAGETTPTVFMELKSIGLSEAQTPQLSEALCHLMQDKLGVDANRIYIEFSSAARKMWGWNGSTF